MKAYAGDRGEVAEKTYFFYTTCPRCAKHYGKNYVVAVAKVCAA
jgi:NMD protein affecting ribosome stability and mRNA decay